MRIIIALIFLASWPLVEQKEVTALNQDNRLCIFRIESIEDFSFYHVQEANDSLLIITKRFLNDSIINSLKIHTYPKTNKIYLKNDSVYFKYRTEDLNNHYQVIVSHFQPGTVFHEVYSYSSFPYFIE